MPPRRVPGFNSAVQHDDGLLIGSVARREGLSYDAARMEVECEILTLRRRIEAGEEVTMPRVGTFESGTDGAALTFAPAVERGITGAMLSGLPRLTVSPLVAVSSEPHEPDYEHKGGDVRRRVMSVMKYAASVAVLVGMGLTFTTPLAVDRESVDFAALATPKVKMTALPTVTSDDSRDLYIMIPDRNEATAQAEVRADDYRYFLVIASCASRREALRYIKRQKDAHGVTMSVLERDGRHRVYVVASDKEGAIDEFRGANAEFMQKHPDAWVYNKY